MGLEPAHELSHGLGGDAVRNGASHFGHRVTARRSRNQESPQSAEDAEICREKQH